MATHLRCWCGNTALSSFSDDYLCCRECGTLVVKRRPQKDPADVEDENNDLYGANYFDTHYPNDLGLPDFSSRSRSDIKERCIYWLQHLIEWKLPGAHLLEIGCFHGAFLALARLAGYSVRGLELSPEICRRASTNFGIDTLVGPLQKHNIPSHSLDVIVMFDVLEHLDDPVGTLTECRRVLKQDGVLMIQTPAFPLQHTYASLREQGSPFLKMLLPNEHLFLFSTESVVKLCEQTGFPHARFAPAIFGQYDMFLAISACPVDESDASTAEKTLASTPNGRIAQALIDLFSEKRALERAIQHTAQVAQEREKDANDRLVQISERDARILTLDADLAAANAQARELIAARDATIGTLQAQVDQLSALVVERDRRLAALDSDLAAVNDQAREQIFARDSAIASLQAQVDQLSALVAERDRHLAALDSDLAAVNAQAREQISARDSAIASLQARIDQLTAREEAHERQHTVNKTTIETLESEWKETSLQLRHLKQRLQEVEALLEQAEKSAWIRLGRLLRIAPHYVVGSTPATPREDSRPKSPRTGQ